MFLKRFRRKERSGDAVSVDGSPAHASEMEIFALLTDSRRKHKCSAEFVHDLGERIMRPALAELNQCFGGQRWIRAIQPLLTLEGPGVDFRISITKVEG